jgi:general secretion pathway protein F
VPQYSYKATTRDGRIYEGQLEADSEKKAVEQIQALGNIPLHISQKNGVRGQLLSQQFRPGNFFKRVSRKNILLFTQEFHTLFAAGLPLDRCLTVLIEVTVDPKLKGIIEKVLSQVRGGHSLADAFAEHPKVFPKLYVNMVRAGEAGGVLAPIFKRLSDYLERTQELKENVISALIYPTILVTVGGTSIIFMMAFVIPRFALIFADLGQSLPPTTAFLLWASDFFRSYWWAILGFVAGIGVSLRYYARTDSGKLSLDALKLRLFMIGDLVRKIETARLARTLGTLIKSGVPILNSLTIVREVMSNQIMSNALKEVSTGIKGGKGISQPLKKSGVFPPLAIHLIAVGEETGRLDDMLIQIAENYDREITDAVKRFISLLEPAMILIMGLLIGFVVVSMLLAIFSVNDVSF